MSLARVLSARDMYSARLHGLADFAPLCFWLLGGDVQETASVSTLVFGTSGRLLKRHGHHMPQYRLRTEVLEVSGALVQLGA